MPSVKYLQLILMNLTVAGLSSSEFGETSRRRDVADVQFETPSCRTLETQIRDLNVWPEPDISFPLTSAYSHHLFNF